jgi:hypothetical protein
MRGPKMLWVWLAAAAVVLALLAWYAEHQRHQIKAARFSGRPRLSVDEIVQCYFESTDLPPRVIADVWKETAKTLRLDPGLLRPSDRFDRELTSVPGFPVEDEFLALDDKLDELGHKPDESRISTLGEYVEYVARNRMAGRQ